MPSLFHTLGIGADSLYMTRQGVDTAGHNIANAQTEGYSRQRVNPTQREPLQRNGIIIGNGAYAGSITRSHDKFTENQINRNNQESGRGDTRFQGMQALEVIFSPEMRASVADELTNFFNSLQELSAFPEDFTVRTNVVESGRNLVNAVQQTDAALRQQRSDFNEEVFHTTGELNDKLKAIAQLNVRINALEVGTNQEANDLLDQRDRLLRDVSKTVEVSYYEDQFGMLMLRGPNGVTLVDRGNAAEFTVSRGDEGMYDIFITDWESHNPRNVTDKIRGGELQALVNLRDEVVTGLIDRNNQMALTLTEEFNNIHRDGYGVNEYAEQTGRNFFRTIGDARFAAQGFALDDAVLQSNAAIAAASSPLAPGDNVNLNRLAQLRDAKIMGEGRVTLNQYFADYVGALGLDVVRAGHVKEANDILAEDLMNKREAVSGVSMDEEAMNLLKWQSNFTASSKVITTIDEMLDTVLSLKR